MTTVKSYLSLIKFSHTIFPIPFPLIGFTLGLVNWNSGLPGRTLNETVGWAKTNTIHIFLEDILLKLLLVILCMIFARSAAMAFNRYLDRNFDAKNPRT